MESILRIVQLTAGVHHLNAWQAVVDVIGRTWCAAASSSPLPTLIDELNREGARRMLAETLKAEFDRLPRPVRCERD
ncbi:hypothetical protein [Nonomuraea sp. NPDC049141]|uniref:hypothetical protein n=1 Tax=Nonomuraea sp. NPDC049141 TaxID=3155500 RepID=UPI00340F0EFE